MANATSTQLQELYVAYFGRAADPTGLDYWTEKGITQKDFAANQYLQPEFNSAYASKSTEAQVNQIYKNLFDREADVTGLTYWTQQINLGNLELASIAINLIHAAQNNEGSEADKTALTNRTNAAVAYTAKVKESTAAILAFQPTTADPWVAGANITEAVTYLSGIDGTTAHTDEGVAASVTTISTNGAPSAVGKTYTLTTGVDTFEAGGAADTFSGTVGNADPTITAGDSLIGGAGSDIFTIVSTGTAGTVAGVSMSGIETLRVSDTSTGATTINIAGISGITTLESFGSAQTGLVTFSNVGALTDIKLSNISAGGTNTVTYVSSVVAGSSDTQKITLDTATQTGDVTVAGIETFNITASGESTLALAGAAATTVNVTASDDTTIDLDATANSSLATVTADGSAGDVTFTLDFDNSVNLAATGGDGDDLFDTSAGDLATSDSIDGGAGTDTIRFQATADTTTAAIAATGATITNVERVELEADDDGGAGAAADFTLDLDVIDGVESILLDSNDTEFASVFTLQDLNATQAGAITAVGVAGTTNGTNIELDLKDGSGTSDSATITATVASGNTFTVGDSNANIESLTVALNGDENTTLTLDASDFSTGTAGSLTVTGGAAGRTMTITQSTSNAISDTIDLSGVASDVTITLGSANQTITGGTGDDTFTFGTNFTANDTVDGGDGNDKIIIDPATTIATAATVSNVEELEIGATATVTVNVSNFSVPEIVLQAQAATTNVVTLSGVDGVTNFLAESHATASLDDYNGITFTGSGYAGTADSITITSDTENDAVTLGAFTLNGIEDINISVTGDSTEDTFTVGNLINNAVNTMTVTSTGFGDATTGTDIVLGSVGDAANGMTSFDASGADTGVSVTLADMAANSTITGSPFRDTIVLTNSAGGEFLNAGAGNDTLTASASGSTIDGQAGNDTINGAAGADTLTGGAGNDTIDGNAGNDTIDVGTGADTVFFAGAGTDGSNTITNFTAGAGGDIIDLGTNSANEAAAAINGFAIVADTGAVAANSGLIVVSDSDITGTTQAAVTALRTASAVTLLGSFDLTTDEFYLLTDDGTDSYLFNIDAGDTVAGISSGDAVNLIATFSGISDASTFTTANFVDFL